jgi:ubiquinone/menaquinone biosynthesis C-methylase UbiE
LKTKDPLRAKVEAFDRDAIEHNGYIYTTDQRKSSQMATANMRRLVRGCYSFEGKRVADVGCGDGFMTERFWEEAKPAWMVGADPAPEAIKVAKGRRPASTTLDFVVADGHYLPWADDSFDVALLHAMLHHDHRPKDTIKEAFRVAREIVILEPNGNNVGLKVIEKASRYHREHQERSYASRKLLRWVGECGGTVVRERFAGLVPMFCPDWMASTTKTVEPVVERSALLSYLGCAVICVVARRTDA